MSTLTFETFWTWLQNHGNCIVRVATPDSVLYDDEELHWWLGTEGGLHVAQVIRGKRLRGEVVIDPERISYVEALGELNENEFVFELIDESEADRMAAFQIALVHGLDDQDDTVHGHAVH